MPPPVCGSWHRVVGATETLTLALVSGGTPSGLVLVQIRKGLGSQPQTPPSNPLVKQHNPRDDNGCISLKTCVSLKTNSECEECIKKGILSSIKHHSFMENFLSAAAHPDPYAGVRGSGRSLRH